MRIRLAIDESSGSGKLKNVFCLITTVRVLHAVAKFVSPAAALLDAGGSPRAAHGQVLTQYQKLMVAVAARLQGQGIYG